MLRWSECGYKEFAFTIFEKALQSNDLPTEFVKWREMAADRNQWRAICGSKMPSAIKATPTSSRQDIWAELRYGTIHNTTSTGKCR
jgi:hypothetical protein